MKRTAATLLAILMMLSAVFSSCGGSASPSQSEAAEAVTPQTQETQDTDAPPEDVPPEEDHAIPEALIGTWIVVAGTVTIGGEEISEFTIDGDNHLIIAGKTYFGKYYDDRYQRAEFAEDESMTDRKFEILLNENGTSFDGETLSGGLRLMSSGDTDIIYTGNPRFYKDLKKIDLTLDNWQEYFEIADEYRVMKDAFGEATGISREVLFRAKENVLWLVDGALEIYGENTGVQRVHYNLSTDEYSYTDDLTAEEEAFVLSDRFQNSSLAQPSTWTAPISSNWVDDKPLIRTGITVHGYGEHIGFLVVDGTAQSGIRQDGDEITALIRSQQKYEVKRIAGTVYVQENG